MYLYLCFAALYDKKRIVLNLMDSTGRRSGYRMVSIPQVVGSQSL